MQPLLNNNPDVNSRLKTERASTDAQRHPTEQDRTRPVRVFGTGLRNGRCPERILPEQTLSPSLHGWDGQQLRLLHKQGQLQQADLIVEYTSLQDVFQELLFLVLH